MLLSSKDDHLDREEFFERLTSREFMFREVVPYDEAI